MSVKGRKASRYTQGSQSDSTAPPKSLLLCVATGIKAPKVSSIPSAAGHSLCRRPAVGIKQSSTFSGTPYPLRIMRVSISESDRASGRPWPPWRPRFLHNPLQHVLPAVCSQHNAATAPPTPVLQSQLLPGDSVDCTPQGKVPGLPVETPPSWAPAPLGVCPPSPPPSGCSGPGVSTSKPGCVLTLAHPTPSSSVVTPSSWPHPSPRP